MAAEVIELRRPQKPKLRPRAKPRARRPRRAEDLLVYLGFDEIQRYGRTGLCGAIGRWRFYFYSASQVMHYASECARFARRTRAAGRGVLGVQVW